MTSTCLKSQVVDLKAEGYWEELMDTTRPDIEVKDWFAARPDCGSKYQLCVQLLSSAHAPLGTFQPDPVMIQQKSDAKWREVCGQGPHGNLGLTCFSRRIGVSFQLRQQSRETERAPTQKQFPERMPPWCTDCLASIHRALCSIPSAKK